MSKHLIIFSLHRDESFLSKAVKHLVTKLESEHEEVIVRDLYRLQFDPVLTSADFDKLKLGKPSKEILNEQKFIEWAEYIWVIFPVWWTGMPAILKGYIDRVFLTGFAYKMEGDKPIGLLMGKEVIILNSMGMSEEDYESTGIYKAMQLTIDKGIFEFVGMNVIAHKYFTSIMSANDEKRKTYLSEIEQMVDSILAESTINSIKLKHCDN